MAAGVGGARRVCAAAALALAVTACAGPRGADDDARFVDGETPHEIQHSSYLVRRLSNVSGFRVGLHRFLAAFSLPACPRNVRVGANSPSL